MDALSRLAHSARDGRQGALEAFVDAAYDQVWRLCATLVDRQSADDLAQETFVRAVRTLPRFRGDASARTWLLAVARHACLDELRSRGRRRRLDGELAALGGAEAGTQSDASQQPAVADLVSQLERDRRTAFVLTQMLGLSYAEASQVCECPKGTIRSRVARARADLLELLGELGGERSPRPRRRYPTA
ncbi:MAG: sigma-70 family RNA polymerase sigma factor [Acidimicrobiales bacterium]